MKQFTRFLSFVVLPLSVFSNAHASSEQATIVGGEDAKEHAFPFMISLQSNGRHFCGASLINQNTVITAAHCVYNQNAENLKVSLGRHNLKNDEKKTNQTIQVSEFFIHPDFSYSTLQNDVAIIHLKDPVEYTDAVQPIVLDDTKSAFEGEDVSIIGWGRLSSGFFSPLPDVLQMAKTKIVKFDDCVDAYKSFSVTVKEGMICAASPGIDTCQGDSGGPLFQDNKLIGLTSWGYGCANEKYPGVYTQVSHYMDFIKSNILE